MALFVLAFGAIVIIGSLRVGIGWGIEGPRAGFFPFYIGLFIVAAGLITLFQTFLNHRTDKLFAEWGQLGQVLSVVLPATIYVAIIPVIGIYVASILLISVFMKWLGRYGWGLTLAIAVGVPAVTFVVFERWFLVALPKGPIEDLLGL